MAQAEKAMDVSERCIRAYYDTPGCHLDKGRALLSIGNSVEGIESISKTKTMAEACIDQEVIKARAATDPR